MMPELSRRVALDQIGGQGVTLAISTSVDERAALARRFGLLAIDALDADVRLAPEAGGVRLTGDIKAAVVYRCRVTNQPVPGMVRDRLSLLFLPPDLIDSGGDEVELSEAALDVEPLDGGAIDAGEAVAQTLSLALDPFPRAPDADAALDKLGIQSENAAKRNPFGVLLNFPGGKVPKGEN
jgi:uncharacterized metal-binding protein YceD (DUF177 family)